MLQRHIFQVSRSLCPGGSCAAARIPAVFAATLYSQAGERPRRIVLVQLARSFMNTSMWRLPLFRVGSARGKNRKIAGA